MENQNDNIIELIGENGEAVQFEHLATIEHEGEYYIALMLLDDESDEEDTEVVIMQIDQDENGEEIYVMVEDEDVEAAVFEKFLAMMEEEGEDEE